MRFESYQLDVKQDATGTGAALKCEDLADKTLVITGIAGGCVLDIEGTVDGALWVTSGTTKAINANAAVQLPETFAQIRVNRTTKGTGNPNVTLGARNSRTDR